MLFRSRSDGTTVKVCLPWSLRFVWCLVLGICWQCYGSPSPPETQPDHHGRSLIGHFTAAQQPNPSSKKIVSEPRDQAGHSDNPVFSACHRVRLGLAHRRTLPNPAASKNAISVVEHQCLTGSDSKLRLLETDGHIIAANLDSRRRDRKSVV